jgi:signal transduction histidine kinase
VDVSAVVHDVLTLERLGEGDPTDDRRSGVRWEADVPTDGSACALAQRDELREVVINLLENARLADARTVTVRVVRDHGEIRLTVEDDGTGIPADVLPRIFEPHFSTRTSGSGLGLAISRRLIEGWGGAIGVASSDPRGTVVRITLPAVPEALG